MWKCLENQVDIAQRRLKEMGTAMEIDGDRSATEDWRRILRLKKIAQEGLAGTKELDKVYEIVDKRVDEEEYLAKVAGDGTNGKGQECSDAMADKKS